jgi:hypothetical protein
MLISDNKKVFCWFKICLFFTIIDGPQMISRYHKVSENFSITKRNARSGAVWLTRLEAENSRRRAARFCCARLGIAPRASTEISSRGPDLSWPRKWRFEILRKSSTERVISDLLHSRAGVVHDEVCTCESLREIIRRIRDSRIPICDEVKCYRGESFRDKCRN